MSDVMTVLQQWDVDVHHVREQVYRASTPRERERWHALWLLTHGWSADQVGEASSRDAHTIGLWLAAFRDSGPAGLAFEQTGGSPPVLNPDQQAAVKAAVRAPPATVGTSMADWNWKVVRAFPPQRFEVRLSKTSCVDYLHRLGFVVKRPKKHFLKADEAKRDAFVEAYTALLREARERGEKLFFADEAHFRADADLRGKWVQRGQPALVDKTSPRWGEKASYYSAVCLETGEVEAMELEGNSTAATSAAFLKHLRERHPEPVVVVWDNSPAHHGEALRAYLSTPGVRLRLVNLPAYSPDFNGDEAVWDWARDEVTANTCLGTKAKVKEKLGAFFAGLTQRTEEVKRRCRTVLQARADALLASTPQLPLPQHVDPTPVLV